MKNLLFITWDGPQTSYIEGLFMPIFQEIAKQGDYQFHVVQFTWADDEKIAHTKAAADKMGITYTAWPVLRKPNVSIGGLLTVLTSSAKIKKYIRENNIHIVMPRSTFPAMIVNQQTGFLVPPNTPAKIAEKIRYFVHHPEAVSSMGEAGYHRAMQHYTEERYVKEVEALYLDLLKQKGIN